MCGARPSARIFSVVSVTSSWIAEPAALRGRPDRRDKASGSRVAGRPRRHRLAKRRQRVRADDPRADAGQEILGEERPERLIFPRLQIARRPVVEQAITGDMLGRLADRDRLPELVALADPDAELELVIEAPARAIFGRIGVGRLALAARADHRLARGAHRACTAVIADRHIFVVGQQRIVGPELLADIGRVMDADVEIGVVADQARHVHPNLALADQLRLDFVAIFFLGQQFGQAQAQRVLRPGPARQPSVEHRLRQILAPILIEQIGDRRQGRGR